MNIIYQIAGFIAGWVFVELFTGIIMCFNNKVRYPMIFNFFCGFIGWALVAYSLYH